jgi:hypothetical protein
MKIIFPTEAFEQRCREQEIVGETFLSEGFAFLLDDNPELRSPFPAYTHDALIQNSFQRIMHWAFEQDKKNVTDEILSTVFQGIVFEEGQKLVATDDERLTIAYPELPRIGDTTSIPDKGNYKISRRHLYQKDDALWLKIFLQNTLTGHLMETEFEISA